MAMTFDATLKDMAREDPFAALATFDGVPSRPIRLLNVDLSTITLAADLVIGLGDPLEEIIHLDFQASANAWKHADLMVYNAALYAHYHVPVHTLVVLLRPQAAHSNMNGTVGYTARPGRGRMGFEYEIVRLWERPAEELLAGALGTLPLAVLGKLPEGVSLEDGIVAVARRVVERLEAEATPDRKVRLLTSAFLLTGLRVPRGVAKAIFQRVGNMSESDTYNMIVEEGEEKRMKMVILRFGQKRLGPADAAVTTRLNAISDLERLDTILDRTLEAASWQELLDTP